MREVPSISVLANMALVALENCCEASRVLADRPCHTESPLGQYLGQTIIANECKILWRLPARKSELEASCRLALWPLGADLRSLTQTESDILPVELVFAMPGDAQANVWAKAWDHEGGMALRAVVVSDRTRMMHWDEVEITVNFGVRPKLNTRS